MANTAFTREHASVHTEALVAAFLGLSADTAGRVTDFNDGSVTKDIFEALALELERLDTKAFLALQRAIPTILYEFFGDGDGVTTTVGFPLLPALRATGLVRFTRTAEAVGDIMIDVGVQLQVRPPNPGDPVKVYETIVPATLAAGTVAVDTLAQATVAGPVGNTPANTMELKGSGSLLSPLGGIKTATNPTTWLSGRAAETEEGRFQRFRRAIRNLARAQEPGIEYGALHARVLVAGQVTERVLFARATRLPYKRGVLHVVIDNGGGGASPALVTAAQTLIDGGYTTTGRRVPGYVAAGIDAHVIAVVSHVVDVTCTITPERGFVLADLQSPVAYAIAQHLFGLGVFADLILADLICAVVSLRGIADVQFATPTANVTVAAGKRIIAGAITVHG